MAVSSSYVAQGALVSATPARWDTGFCVARSRGQGRRPVSSKRMVAVLGASALVLASCSWGQAGFDARRAGWNAVDRSFTKANISGLGLSWQATVGVTSIGAGAPSPVMDAQRIFVVAGSQLVAYAADGGPNCSGAPKMCAPLWTASLPFAGTSEPVVSGGRVYVGGSSSSAWQLVAFDAAGTVQCAGVPLSCTPVMRASWGATGNGAIVHLGAAGSYLYFATEGFVSYQGPPSSTFAFDAGAVTGCSPGVPAVCAPIFSASGGLDYALPTIADGMLYLPSSSGISAFDAQGSVSCGGLPKTCQPIRIFATPNTTGSAVVSDGFLYVSTGQQIFHGNQNGTTYVFDASGSSGCAGVPVVCQAAWSVSGPYTYSLPVVAAGKLYLSAHGATDTTLDYFDAKGTVGCGGSPKTCQRLGVANFPTGTGDLARAAATNSLIFVVTSGNGIAQSGRLMGFGLDGSGCHNTPTVCDPLASVAVGLYGSGPAVANGRIAFISELSEPTRAVLGVYGLPG